MPKGRTSRPIGLAALLLLLASSLEAAAPDDVVMKALRDELQRSMAQLRLENLEKPYFIAYRVEDRTDSVVSATFGKLVMSQQTRVRLLTVELRVGDYSLDNSNFLSFPSFGRNLARSFGNTARIPLNDDYKEIRRQIWLATDAAYKSALETLAQKRAALQNKTRTEDIPDFTKEPPLQSYEPGHPLNLKLPQVEPLVRDLSGIFRSIPEVYTDSVQFAASDNYTRYVNSEGTEFTRAAPYVSLVAMARTQAGDGMAISDAVWAYGRALSDLPGQAELETKVREMAARLKATRSTPLAERYNGPVLFEGQAAAEVFARVFLPKLLASRRPVSPNPQMEMVFSRSGNPFQDKIGGRVLPDFLGIVDDPTRKEARGMPLVGGFSVDDDGLRGSEKTLIEHGILKTLLTTRDPVPGLTKSTGNRRAYGVAPSNVLVEVENGLSDEQMRERLLSLIRQRSKPYGLLVRRIQNPLVSDPSEMVSTFVRSMMPGTGEGSVIKGLLLVSKIFPDGHEEPVRNAELEGMDAGSFREIVAASSNEVVYSTPFIEIGGSVMNFLASGALGGGEQPPLVSLVVPSLLFDDLTLKPVSGEIPGPPLSGRP